MSIFKNVKLVYEGTLESNHDLVYRPKEFLKGIIYSWKFNTCVGVHSYSEDFISKNPELFETELEEIAGEEIEFKIDFKQAYTNEQVKDANVFILNVETNGAYFPKGVDSLGLYIFICPPGTYRVYYNGVQQNVNRDLILVNDSLKFKN